MEMKSVFRDATPYSLRERHQCFGEIAVSIFRLLWSFLSQYTTSFLKDSNLNIHGREDHTSHIERTVVPMEDGKFLDQLSDYELLKEDPAP
jgi:hypothetical protein